ncbi:MAG: DUF6519 domain-containing protein [Acidobacteriia bacterium]|nr:DUF6519 domain-containing protein [Terriglobia bacterium]
MKGDFTRDTFQRMKHFSRVLEQQGRVTIDADRNEQTAILLHYLRMLARDLIGPCGAPEEKPGFTLKLDKDGNLKIGAGRYYVDGILVENEEECAYIDQPDYTVPDDDALRAPNAQGGKLWVYLDVWERHITALEDDSIREKALGGPDTSTRAQVVWQVKALEVGKDISPAPQPCDLPSGLFTLSTGSMAARLDPGKMATSTCVLAPSSKYRGAENHLYRVEIHDGNLLSDAAPTFKWSRDNGSIVTAWLGTDGDDLLVPDTRGFESAKWVELSDDDMELQGRHGWLVGVTKTGDGRLSMDKDSRPKDFNPSIEQLSNPKVRRWDQNEKEGVPLVNGAVQIKAAAQVPNWIDLEDGVQVQFSTNGKYRTGDYWLILARVGETEGILEWPVTDDKGPAKPDTLTAAGVEHHYAPLGIVQWIAGKLSIEHCSCEFRPASSCAPQGSGATGDQNLRLAQKVKVVPKQDPVRETKKQRATKKTK